MFKNIGIIGAGSWGTTLAKVVAEKNVPTMLWARNPELCVRLQQQHENKDYLPNIKLPNNIVFTNSLADIASNDIIVFVTPSHATRSVAQEFKNFNLRDKILLTCSKGLELETFLRISEVIAEELPGNEVAVLSGPNQAEEISRRQLSATVVASKIQAIAEVVQDVFSTKYFRVYTNNDVLGVEIAGAFKNIIAVSTGILDGLGLGDNARSALVTRGLAEISRLGIAMGASPLTFSGLAGVGDLICTCTSRHSRNRWAGEELGRGKSLKEITGGTKMVVEGVRATYVAKHLAEKYKVEMPITNKLYEILYEEKKIEIAIEELMSREKSHETEKNFI